MAAADGCCHRLRQPDFATARDGRHEPAARRAAWLGPGRAGVLGVDPVAADGVFDFFGFALPGVAEAIEDGHDDVGGIGLEMAPQRLAGVAAAETVRAQRDKRLAGRATWSGTAFMKSVTATMGPRPAPGPR